MRERPRISVIVPHFNDLTGLDACLATLEHQTYPRGRFEILVADNGSPQGLAEVQKIAGSRASVVLVEERGAGPARNGAVARASGEVFAFIDSDCQAEPEWLEEGVKALTDFDFVGGRVRVLVQDPARMTSVEAFERVFAFNFEDYINRQGFSGAGNLFSPRRVFEAVGGFRSGMSEDVEWSRRAVAAGFRLGYAPKAIVGHPARRSWEDLTRKWRRVNAETLALSDGARGQRVRWIVRTLALPVSAVVHTPRVLLSRELDTMGQRVAAIAVLYRIRIWRLWHAFQLLGQSR